MSLTSDATRADRSWCKEGDGQWKVGDEPMTAFKSDRSMHLKGKSAQRWAKKIKAEKAQQKNGKAKKK
jgi:hypothetical protein